MSTSPNGTAAPQLPKIAIAIRLNGELARLAGRARLAMTLPEGSTIEALLTEVGQKNPSLADRLNQAVPVVNGSHASRDRPLVDGEEVALLMPVAGGK